MLKIIDSVMISASPSCFEQVLRVQILRCVVLLVALRCSASSGPKSDDVIIQVSMVSCNLSACLNQRASTPEFQKEIVSIGKATDIIIVGFGVLSDCNPLDTKAITDLAQQSKSAIVAACGQHMVIMAGPFGTEARVITDEGPPRLPPNPQNAAIQLRLQGINRTIVAGVVLGSTRLWDPLVARALMLQGAELIITLDNSPQDRPYDTLSDVHGDMLLTRGFENTAGILHLPVSPAMSAPSGDSAHVPRFANWCNDMLPTGCRNGSHFVHVDVISDAGSNFSHFQTNFSISDLRMQREVTIWGDAFRRPYTYQELCGFYDPLESVIRPAAAHWPPDAVNQAPDGSSVQPSQNVRVAIAQLETCTSEAACTRAAVQAVTTAVHMGGADVVLFPEMWSVGYGAQYPHLQARRHIQNQTTAYTVSGTDPEPFGNASWLRRLYQYPRLASDLQGTFASAMRQVARDSGVAVVAGMMRRHEACGIDGDAETVALTPPYNSAVLFAPNGSIQFAYNKVTGHQRKRSRHPAGHFQRRQ
eukprot:m.1397484 g.1397484  ORF g.1397484 m.1397484 type:complete len:531 (+) comp24997_c1_seq19:228-1820(+)